MESYPSRLLESAVAELSKLPGLGRKTALRLALHLLRQDETQSEALGTSLIRLRKEIQYCKRCFNISDTEVCSICSDSHRDNGIICVVEDIRDVMAIENTGQFRGRYFVLGGLISPLHGIGPDDINVKKLISQMQSKDISELVLALAATVEGDSTSFYIFRQLRDKPITISVIPRGISIGDELEYMDEVTLGRSILARIPYESSLQMK